MARSGGTRGQSIITRRRHAVAEITGKARRQMFDMADRIILARRGHARNIVTVASITGIYGVDTVRPCLGSDLKGVSPVAGPLAAIGMTADVITGTGTAGSVGRSQVKVRRSDGELESAGRNENILERPLVVGGDKFGIMTKSAGKFVIADRPGVGSMRG